MCCERVKYSKFGSCVRVVKIEESNTEVLFRDLIFAFNIFIFNFYTNFQGYRLFLLF